MGMEFKSNTEDIPQMECRSYVDKEGKDLLM